MNHSQIDNYVIDIWRTIFAFLIIGSFLYCAAKERKVEFYIGTELIKEEYFGEIKNGKRDGEGKNTRYLKDGSIFETYFGDWKDNVRHGKGHAEKFHWPGKKLSETYDGEWKNDCYNGEGTIKIFSDTERFRVYEGSFLNCEMEGNGILKTFRKEGDMVYEYVGEMRNDRPHGTGEIVYYENGEIRAKYKGGFKKGKKSGYGVRTSIFLGEESKKSGQWKNGRYIYQEEDE